MTAGMFFTNHMRVFTLVADKPDLRLREIASEAGITERAAHRIISELVDEGYLARERTGSRNQYVTLRVPPVDPLAAQVLRRAIEPRTNGHQPASARADKFDAVFEAIPAGVVVVDGSGKIVAVNRAFCELLGQDRKELLGRAVADCTHPDDLAGYDEYVSPLVTGGRREAAHEQRYVRADGTLVCAEVRVARMVDPETGAPLLVTHVVEVDDRGRQDRELAEAEERFRSSFDNAPIGMALVALDGRWLKVNRALCEITGYSETALLTRTFQSITHPDDLEADLEYRRQMLTGEITKYQMDKRYHHASGRIIWASLSVSLVRGAAGEPLYFISQVKDITQRRSAEGAIRRVVDRIAEAVSIIEADGTHLHVNTASRTILDDLRARVGEAPIADLDWGAITEDGAALAADALPAEITRRTGEEIDEAVVGFSSASGEIRWLRISTRRLSDGPAPYQVVVSYTDITRRKQAERALALSEARLEGLFRNIPAALSLRDLEGRYLHLTDSVARALGRTPEDAIGRNAFEHLDGEVLSQALADDNALRAGEGPITREVTTKHADGSDHSYYVLKWPVHDENGNVAALGAFSLDITERNQAEQRIRDLLKAMPWKQDRRADRPA